MKDWKLIDAIGKIDDRFILEADEEAVKCKTKLFSFHGKELRKGVKHPFIKTAVAACLMLSLILPNVSEQSAYALQAIPGLGRYFQFITLRKYSFNDGNHSAKVQTPYLAVDGLDAEGDALKEEKMVAGEAAESEDLSLSDGSASLESEKANSAEKINLDIEKKTEEWIREFKEELAGTEFKNLDVSSDLILNSEDYYVLSLSVLKQEGDSETVHHYYTVDKKSGKLLSLPELFSDRTDYKKILSDEVKRQIKEHNRSSENKYFVRDGEDNEGFEEIGDEQSFYINADNQLVLVFPQGEVAPMSMGESQFIMPKSIWQES